MARNPTLQIVIEAVDKATKQLKTISGSFAQTGEKMKSLGTKMSLGVSLPLGVIGAKMVNLAGDAEEVQNKFETAFSGIEKKAGDAAADLVKNYNLSRTASKRLLSDTGDLLKGFGFTADEALNLSSQTQKLAADLASYNNVQGGAEAASEILTKALLGERDALISLGAKVSEEDVKLQLLKDGTDKLTGSALMAARAQATMTLILGQTVDAQGDVFRSQGSFKQSTEKLRASLANLGEDLGTILIPIAQKLTETITSLTQWFASLDRGTQTFIVTVGALVAILGPSLVILGSVAGAISKLTFVTGGLSAALTFLSAHPLVFIAIKITALILLAGALITHWDKVANWFSNFGENFKNIWENITEYFFTMVDQWKIVIDDFLAVWGKFWDGMKSFTNSAVDSILASVSKMVNWVIDGVNKVIKALNRVPGISIDTVGSVDFGGAIARAEAVAERVSQLGSADVQGPLQARANGGNVNYGTPYLVGERGPELFIPKSSGDIIPNEFSGVNISVMSGATINVGDEADERRLAEKISQTIARQLELLKFNALA